MGTLTHANGKGRGSDSSRNTPGRCRWCGETLRPVPGAAEGGYLGNGAFCSLRCGFQWAVLQTTGWAFDTRRQEGPRR